MVQRLSAHFLRISNSMTGQLKCMSFWTPIFLQAPEINKSMKQESEKWSVRFTLEQIEASLLTINKNIWQKPQSEPLLCNQGPEPSFGLTWMEHPLVSEAGQGSLFWKQEALVRWLQPWPVQAIKQEMHPARCCRLGSPHWPCGWNAQNFKSLFRPEGEEEIYLGRLLLLNFF